MKFLNSNIFETAYADTLLDRFLKYVKIHSTSSSQRADEGIIPSTPQQREFADVIAQELRIIGFEEVTVTENSYVYAYIPATPGKEEIKPFCILSHLDTSEEVSGKNVNPQIIRKYDGRTIVLAQGSVLDPREDKELFKAGQQEDTIITSDGNTLLGADDKAGLAEIVTALEFILKHPEIEHGKIEVCFSPDEETGHGMDKVPLNLIQSKMAYTVDGGTCGELETECFNAYKSEITFTGIACHTGTARGQMVNAISMAAKFLELLPQTERPETTDGYQGFFAPMQITGSIENARLVVFLRDFETTGMERRKKLIETIAQTVASSTGGKAEVSHTLQYLNMRNNMEKNPQVVDSIVKAYKNSNILPVFPPIRGGTDGSRLTEMGIPTPNIFTGGHNFHSRTEWASFSSMIKATEVIIQLAQIQAHSDFMSQMQTDNIFTD